MADLGLLLKREREARNISIEEIASTTKIVPRYLEALEADRFDVMPGAFFIKGIIRTYCRYIGLDEEEILSKYRAAGVLGESSQPKRSFSPAPPASPSPPFLTSDGPTPRTRLLVWLVVAGILVILLALVFLLTWTARVPKTALQPAAVTIPSIDQPEISPPEAEEPDPASAPLQEEWPGVTMDISFEAETWMQVYADGILKIDGLFPPGAKAKAHASTELLIHVGNAGGFRFLLNGQPGKPLGRSGAVIKDIQITAANFKDFLQAQSPDPPAD